MNIDFKITDILTLPASIMAALSLASGVFLFASDSFINRLYLVEFREEYGSIVGTIFLVFTCILTINLIINIAKAVDHIRTVKSFNNNVGKKLRELSVYQKTIVYGLYEVANHTKELPIHDGAIIQLEQSMVIVRTTDNLMVDDIQNPLFPYFLQSWVVKELDSDKKLNSEFKEAVNVFLKTYKRPD